MGIRDDNIRRALSRAARLISEAEEQIDEVLWELRARADGQSAHEANGRRAEAPPEPVASLVVGLRRNGSSHVVADKRNGLDLPARLTGLLLFALSGEVGPDGIKSFRLLSEAAKELGSNANGVSSLVYQLREKLRKHGLSPWLLETARRPDGARIRFRARELVVIALDDK